jgi:hypothetical protein
MPADIYAGESFSPDEYLMVTTIQNLTPYIVPLSRFPQSQLFVI